MSDHIGMKDGERCNRVTTGNPGGLFDGKPCIGDMHYPEQARDCECDPRVRLGPCDPCENRPLECDVCGAVIDA